MLVHDAGKFVVLRAWIPGWWWIWGCKRLEKAREIWAAVAMAGGEKVVD